MAFLRRNSDSLFIAVGKNLFVLPNTGQVDSQDVQVVDLVSLSKQVHLSEQEKNKKSESEGEKTPAPTAPKEDVEALCSAVSACGSLIAVGLSSKAVVVLDCSSFEMKRGFIVPKAPTSMCFSKDGQYVVIGDRAGHVTNYAVDESKEVFTGKDVNGESSPFSGSPLTGAISMVLDVAISADGKHLLTADRDEKIRISRYPQSFVVDCFCLGHTQYISTISLLGDRVFSAGGDGMVKEWNQTNGKEVASSEKLDEKPVRRIAAYTKDSATFVCVVMENSDVIQILNSPKEGQLSLHKSITVGSPVLDICVDNRGADVGVLGVSREGLFELDLAAGSCTKKNGNEALSTGLTECKDAIGSYFKNVTHQNLEEYHKRKIEKMEKMKEKKQNKRKTNDVVEESAQNTKVPCL